ncbi:regulatory protein TetR [Clostridium sp. DL-VIII]|uniref:TetR/AcrR family transcriptional regulator n=1 Tax=Clostridium sp. DL-VIII TaxID=641107 RepID=UPI00023AFBB3|nr:TetR/AcrR family transcriptional regulator [Clostridium sp. DL-VIII]EHI99477.1 regulatory protein TetR [Clostridium sp. DL-VIII]
MNEETANTRKRGDTLVESIYDAAVKLIKEVGYANLNLTFQQIAKTAKTSRSVLYRRWATMFDLLMEIVDDRSSKALGGQLIDIIKNTGTLRGDLLSLHTSYQSTYEEVGPEILSAVLFEIGQGNNKVPEAEVDAAAKNILVMRKLLENAKSRGEKIKEVSDITLALPFNLIRMENLMYKNVDSRQIALFVDEILLPVFTE